MRKVAILVWLAIFEKHIVFVVYSERPGCCMMELSRKEEGNTEERVSYEAHVKLTASKVIKDRLMSVTLNKVF